MVRDPSDTLDRKKLMWRYRASALICGLVLSTGVCIAVAPAYAAEEPESELQGIELVEQTVDAQGTDGVKGQQQSDQQQLQIQGQQQDLQQQDVQSGQEQQGQEQQIDQQQIQQPQEQQQVENQQQQGQSQSQQLLGNANVLQTRGPLLAQDGGDSNLPLTDQGNGDQNVNTTVEVYNAGSTSFSGVAGNETQLSRFRMKIDGNYATTDEFAGAVWSSDNEDVFTVTAAGLIHYVSEGTANIFVTYDGVKSDPFLVQVAKAAVQYTSAAGKTSYYSAANNNLNGMNAGTYKLLEDLDSPTPLGFSTWAKNGEVTFDLNGHSINIASPNNRSAISVGRTGITFNLTGEGIITDTGSGNAVIEIVSASTSSPNKDCTVNIGKDVVLVGSGTDPDDPISGVMVDSTTVNATINIEGTISGGDFGVYVHGLLSEGNGAVINFLDGCNVSGKYGAYLAGASVTMVLDGATISGTETGIELRSGVLYVKSGATITGGDEYSVTPNGNGTTTKGAGIAVAQHTTKHDVFLVINGGDITGGTALSVANPQNNVTENVTVRIADGKFTATEAGMDAVTVAKSAEGAFQPTAYIAGGIYSNETDDPTAEPNVAVSDGHFLAQIGKSDDADRVGYWMIAPIALSEWDLDGLDGTSVYDGKNHPNAEEVEDFVAIFESNNLTNDVAYLHQTSKNSEDNGFYVMWAKAAHSTGKLDSETGLPLNAGTYTGVVTGTGMVTGSVQEAASWEITRASIVGCIVTGIEDSVYDGTEKTPGNIVVTKNDVELVEGVDYQILYPGDHTNAAEVVTFQVKGVGNYRSRVNCAFTIEKAQVVAPAVIRGLVYNGADQSGIDSDTFDEKLVALSGDISATDAGDYVVTASLIDPDNYVWAINDVDPTFDPVDLAWNIAPLSLEDATVDGIEDKVYNGSKQMQDALVVMVGDLELVEGKDFEVVYMGDNTNAGIVTFYIVPAADTPNFADQSEDAYFVIAKATVARPVAVEGLVYNGFEQTGVAATELYTVKNGSAVDAGDYVATAILVDPANYRWADEAGALEGQSLGAQSLTAQATDSLVDEEASVDVKWSIAPKSMFGLKVDDMPDAEYTGSAITEKPLVRDGDKVLKEGVDYELSYFNNVEPGKATVTIKGIGNYDGTLSTSFEIVKDEPTPMPKPIPVPNVSNDSKAGVEPVIAIVEPKDSASLTSVPTGDDLAGTADMAFGAAALSAAAAAAAARRRREEEK